MARRFKQIVMPYARGVKVCVIWCSVCWCTFGHLFDAVLLLLLRPGRACFWIERPIDSGQPLSNLRLASLNYTQSSRRSGVWLCRPSRLQFCQHTSTPSSSSLSVLEPVSHHCLLTSSLLYGRLSYLSFYWKNNLFPDMGSAWSNTSGDNLSSHAQGHWRYWRYLIENWVFSQLRFIFVVAMVFNSTGNCIVLASPTLHVITFNTAYVFLY